MKRILALALVFVIPACATDKDALLNDQNRVAGEYVEQNSVQSEIRQAGKDIKENAQVLAKNAVGEVAPADRKPYTPENSKAARDASDKSHSGGIWPWITGAMALLLPVVFAVARAHPWGAVVANIVEPWAKKLMGIKQEAAASEDGTIHVADVQSHITDLINDPKAGPVAIKVLQQVHAEQLIHSPEAPAFHPDHPDAPPTTTV